MPTLLLIDDDEHFRNLGRTVLGARGHTVIETGRCALAEKLIEERQPDLILLDGLLPDGDGTVWLKKQRSRGMAVPVLFVSAFRKTSRDQDQLRAEHGLQDFLAKPVSSAALIAKVDRVLLKLGAKLAPPSPLPPGEMAALAEMSRAYAGELPGLIAGLLAAISGLRAKPGEDAMLGIARRRAHNIAGTAGSFGFDTIGDTCAAIEQALISLQSGGTCEALEAAGSTLRSSFALFEGSRS